MLLILIYVLFWLMLLGGVIGSFLNVVIYRYPLGQSLSHPPSHCPKCQHPIRWHDNVPVFGWIFLKGRCRDCRAPISMRYPTIEALCALTFVCVGFFVLNHDIVRNDVVSLAEIPLRVWGLIASLLVLVTTLLAAGMIEFDRQKVPAKIYVPVFLVALFALVAESDPVPFAYFTAGPLQFWETLNSTVANIIPQIGSYPVYGGLINVIFGAIGGTVFALIIAPIWEKRQRGSWILAMLGCGLFLGWQLVLGCALVSIVYAIVSYGTKFLLKNERTAPTLLLFLTVTTFVALFF